MALAIHGIRNCDTMKKARAWLDARGVDYAFHDYRVAGIDAPQLSRWADAVGWEVLLNRAGTTFRKLDPADRTDVDREKAIALMVMQPAMIKRPVLEHDGGILVGFAPDRYAAALG